MKTLLIINLVALVTAIVILTMLLVRYINADRALFKANAELDNVRQEKNKLESKLNAYTKPNLTNIYPEVYNIIAAWCKEAGVKQAAVKTKTEQDGTKTLIVYSDRPGYLIGKAGCIIDKYTKIIKKLKMAGIQKVEIEEISGIVNQNQVDVEDYYSSYMANWFAYEAAGEEY